MPLPRRWASGRALSTRSPAGTGASKDVNASSEASGDGVPVKLVRWARYGKTLQPEDVGSVFAYGKLAASSAEPEAVAEARSSLPTVRSRVKLHDPLHSVPKEEIVYTVRTARARPNAPRSARSARWWRVSRARMRPSVPLHSLSQDDP